MYKKSYTHVDETFNATPPCRFCDDPAYHNNKGNIVSTRYAEDGRELFAHPECERDPFDFTQQNSTFTDINQLRCSNCQSEVDVPGHCAECSSFLETPNPVDIDFIVESSTHSINEQLGIWLRALKPGRHPDIANPKVKIPRLRPMTRTQADNVDDEGAAESPHS